MDMLCYIFPAEIIEAFGWAIIHSIWQAGIIAIILVIIVTALKNYSANIRYTIAFIALGSALAWASLTWHSSYQYAKEKTLLREAVLENPGKVAEQIFLKAMTEEETLDKKQASKSIYFVKIRAFLQRNFTVLFYLWAIGVLLFLLRLSGNMAYILTLKARKTVKPDKEWINKVEEYCKKLGLKKKVQLLQSALVKVPLALGYAKPVILLPVSLISGLGTKEIEAIIAHELAHIKRHDYILNILQSIIETIFFYHPAIWLISKIIRNEREHSCDDIALTLTSDKIGYIKALAAAEDFQRQKYAIAFPGADGGLLKRVKRIQNHRTMRKNATEGFIAATIIFVSLIFLSFSIDNQNTKTEDFFQPQNKHSELLTDTIKPKQEHVTIIKIDKDSLQSEFHSVKSDLESVPEELDQLIEIAFTFNDQELADSIHKSIHLAMKDIDFEKIKIEAIKDVDSALSNINIDQIVREAMEEAKAEMQLHKEDLELAKAELEFHKEEIEMAKEELRSLNMDSIITTAMLEAEKALEEIDIEHIVKESMEAAHDALENLEIRVIIEDAMHAAEDALDNIEYQYKYEYHYDHDPDEIEVKENNKVKEKNKKKDEGKRKQKQAVFIEEDEVNKHPTKDLEETLKQLEGE